MAGEDWSREEVETTVGDYFAMLRDELAGLRVNKAEHNERLRRLLRNRSKGSVEFKHANISAVLTLHGYPYIEGYKPRFNFQALLEQVVLEYLVVYRDFFEPLVAGPVLSPTTAPDADAVDVNRTVEAPPEAMRIPQTVWSPSALLRRFDFVARDAANRDLVRRGEEFVEFERFFGLPADYRVTLAFDIESDVRELSNSSQHGGVTLTVHDVLVLRGGIVILDNPSVESGDADRATGGTFGIGIRYNRFEADIAREMSVSELGDETHFGVGVRF